MPRINTATVWERLKRQPDTNVDAFVRLVLDYLGPPPRDKGLDDMLDGDAELRRRARAILQTERQS
jgi:hypothetical protein